MSVTPVNAGLPANFWTTASRATDPVGIWRLLVDAGHATFRAAGDCMAPCVQSGDVLHIVPKQAGQIEVGEIALCCRDGRLFGHRTVSKGEDGEGHYIVTRSDRAAGKADPPSRDAEILGIVDRIERNGCTVLAPDGTSKGVRSELRRARDDSGHWAQARLAHGLWWLQDRPPYRWAAALVSRKLIRQAEYVVRFPYRANPALPFLEKLAGKAIEGFDVQPTGAVQRWSINAVISGRQAASLTFLYRPPECPQAGWWLAEAKVSTRYRGTGIDEELLRRAERILARSGVSCLKASPPGASHEEKLCRRLGFEPREGQVSALGRRFLAPAVVLTRLLS